MADRNVIASLRGRRVLVTRPAHQAASLCRMITAAGGKSVLFPTLIIEDPVDRTALKEAISMLDTFGIALFTSANAVTKTMPHWPTPPPLRIRVGAIGQATARALTGARVRVDPALIAPPPFNSEALLSLPSLVHPQGVKIVLFTGEGGRPLLENTLRARGAVVEKIAVYRRVRPKVDMQALLPAWKNGGVDVILSTSNESLQNLWDLVGPADQAWLRATPLVVSSPRIHDLARCLGFGGPVQVAKTPGDAALVEAVCSF